MNLLIKLHMVEQNFEFNDDFETTAQKIQNYLSNLYENKGQLLQYCLSEKYLDSFKIIYFQVTY